MNHNSETNSAHSFTEGSDSGTLKFSNPVSNVKEETKVSHWPGPYKATELDENTVQIRLERYYVHECIHIADVHVMSGNLGEEVPRAVATAELLASAPDLLKENQELKARLNISNEGSQNLEKARHSAQLACNDLQAINAELLEALDKLLMAAEYSMYIRKSSRLDKSMKVAKVLINKAKL